MRRDLPPPDGSLEQVVLLDDARVPLGSADKASVHGANTPLHLAFSCHLSDPAGRVLMTRRALTKLTWPGVWTNACCGHPGPGEPPEHAVVRRMRQELGIPVSAVRPILPDFAYRAVDASGVVENEVCPVFAAVTDADPVPDPTEVAEVAWTTWSDLVEMARATPWALSPWSVLQVLALDDAGWAPDHR